jgi:hypothetical protein
MLLKTGACFTAELASNCPTIVGCVAALPTGPVAAAGTLVLGKDGQYHALPADSDAQALSIAGNTISLTNGGSVTLPAAVAGPAFATPAQTVAGTSTTLMVNPADLTAKLANQPASGACADRDDVVWNGTVLQGAAKHYNLVGKFPTIVDATTVYTGADPSAPASAVTTIANPSPCRPAILEITGWVECAYVPVSNDGTFSTGLFVNGVLQTGAQNVLNPSGVKHTGLTEREAGGVAYLPIPAGGSVDIGFAGRWGGAPMTLLGYGSAHIYQYHLTTI